MAIKKSKPQIAISIDVEDWYHSRHVSSLSSDPNSDVINFKNQYNKNYNYLEVPLLETLSLLKKYNAKATFFIVADLIEQYEKLIRKMVDEGHEIGCHEMHHISYYGNGDERERELFRKNVTQSKMALEQFTKDKIIGYRAPSAIFRDWMIPELKALGFLYDSSICSNSLYRKSNLDLKNIATAPFFFENRLMEIPWPYLNLFGYRIPTGGGPTLRYFGYNVTKMGINQSLKRGDTSFYFHPLDISNDQLPDVIMEKRKKFWFNKGDVTLKRLKKILARYEGDFCTCREIFEKNLV
ncbi:MAG: polysaccharide deacetylase family protein [Bacteriovoracaceae bacterium]